MFTRSYRYGFNGMESDNEVKGEGNSINFEFRMHDPRVGRFLSVDPLEDNFPNYSPYQFAGNKPIIAIDAEGLEEFIVIGDPSTLQQANNTNRQSVINALQGQNPSQTADLNNVGMVPNGQLIRVQNAFIIWDPTAREREGEAGMIQYVNFNGIGNQMRRLTPQENADAWINERVNMNEASPEFQRVKDEMNKRQDSENDGSTENTVLSGSFASGIVGDKGEAKRFIVITPPPAANLNTRFQGGTANLQNPGQVGGQLAGIANVLNNRTGATVNITGNTSGPVAGNAASPAPNGFANQGAMAAARATAVANLLIRNYGVNPAQINIAVGNVNGGRGMSVQATVNVNNPPNNGNRIDLETGN